MTDYKIEHDEARLEYRAVRDDEVLGFCQYIDDGETVTFTHTVVREEFGGQGIASALAKKALDDLSERGDRTVIPQCSFIAKFISDNSQYADLLAQE